MVSNRLFFNVYAWAGIYPGQADFHAGVLSKNFYTSFLVAGLKLNSIPLKINEGLSGAFFPRKFEIQRAKYFFQTVSKFSLSSDIKLSAQL